MSYNIHTEMPSGITSKGYEYEVQAEALTAFKRVSKQLAEMGFVGDLVLWDGGIEVQRETFHAS